jgi:hypothetical protein
MQITLSELDFDYKTKAEVAMHQLEWAIWFFIEKKDDICAATLAGAAEEIYGKLAEQRGKKSMQTEHVESCLDLLKCAGHSLPRAAEIKDYMNYLRNALKHCDKAHSTEGDVLVIRGAAKEIIDRAINNMYGCAIPPSLAVQNYMKESWR